MLDWLTSLPAQWRANIKAAIARRHAGKGFGTDQRRSRLAANIGARSNRTARNRKRRSITRRMMRIRRQRGQNARTGRKL
jgi:hypothetical protein